MNLNCDDKDEDNKCWYNQLFVVTCTTFVVPVAPVRTTPPPLIVPSPPKTVDGNQNFRKISCVGNWIFCNFSMLRGFYGLAENLGGTVKIPIFSSRTIKTHRNTIKLVHPPEHSLSVWVTCFRSWTPNEMYFIQPHTTVTTSRVRYKEYLVTMSTSS